MAIRFLKLSVRCPCCRQLTEIYVDEVISSVRYNYHAVGGEDMIECAYSCVRVGTYKSVTQDMVVEGKLPEFTEWIPRYTTAFPPPKSGRQVVTTFHLEGYFV